MLYLMVFVYSIHTSNVYSDLYPYTLPNIAQQRLVGANLPVYSLYGLRDRSNEPPLFLPPLLSLSLLKFPLYILLPLLFLRSGHIRISSRHNELQGDR